jgi:hypothetical protein
MKKYYLQCIWIYDPQNEDIYTLFDLQQPRFTEWGLEFKIISCSNYKGLYNGVPIDNYFPIYDEQDQQYCKLLEFESDDDAKLWFEVTYGNK